MALLGPETAPRGKESSHSNRSRRRHREGSSEPAQQKTPNNWREHHTVDSHSTPQPGREQRPTRAVHQAQFQSASGGEQPGSIWPSALPLASPVWFPSVMGTALLSSLLGRQVPDHGWLLYPATALMFLA